MNTNFVALVSALVVAACASPAPTQTAAATTTEQDGKVCTREYRVGSMVPITTCRTQEQLEAERRAADETKDAIRRATRSSGPGNTSGAGSSGGM